MTFTREEIAAMARAADCGHESMTLDWIPPDGLEAFATLVADKAAKKEREACAEVAEDSDHIVDGRGYYAQLGDASATADKIAAAIRARSGGPTC